MTRYSDDTRATAVLMLEAAGYPNTKGALARTAKELKIPAMNLHRWFHAKQNPPPNEVVNIKKEDIIELMKNEIYGALNEMTNARPDADYRELATAIGILTDKLQILTGQPTDRMAIVNELSDDERSARVTALLDRARAARVGQSTSDTGTIH